MSTRRAATATFGLALVAFGAAAQSPSSPHNRLRDVTVTVGEGGGI
jgi:hypothetical protein